MFKIICFVGLSYLLITMNTVHCKPDYFCHVEAGVWLKLHRIPATWQEAFLRCHYEGAVLASPTNKQLTIALISLLAHAGVKGPIFLGTHDLYSKGHFTSIEGVPLSKMEINWSDEVGTDDCLSMSATTTEYFVKTTSCKEGLPFICYRKFNNQTLNACGTFDDDYQYVHRTGSCYKFHKQVQSWSKAYEICDSEGAYLVVLNNKEEAEILKEKFLEHSGQDRMHIGLAAWTDDRIWMINGDKLEDVFNNWDDREPNNADGIQNRAVLVKKLALDDVDPNNKATFACEKSPKSIQFQDLSETFDERFSY